MFLIKLLGLNKYSIYDFTTEKTKKIDWDTLLSTVLRLGYSIEQFRKLETGLWHCRERSKLLDVTNKAIVDLEALKKESVDSALMNLFKSESDYPYEPTRNQPVGRIFAKQF